MNMQPRLPRRAWEAATVILTAACIVLGILLGLTSSETKFQSGRGGVGSIVQRYPSSRFLQLN